MQRLKKGNLSISILHNGAIGEIKVYDIMVNRVIGNALDGSLSNLYLRIWKDGTFFYTPLIGPNSPSTVSVGEESATWSGDFKSISYKVNLKLGNDAWFWHVYTTNASLSEFDITYVQDIGLGTKEYVTSNEAYSSQYLDQYVEQEGKHIIVASRQNQSQNQQYPYLQQGSFTPLTGFDTDGYQFFGASYRTTNIPQDMMQPFLHNSKLQYESSLVAFRSIKIKKVNNESIFYGAFLNNQPNPNVQILINEDTLKIMDRQIVSQDEHLLPLINTKKIIGSPLSGIPISEEQLNSMYPKRLEEEKQNNQLLSFFTDYASHVVLQNKENYQQRPTGNIIIAGNIIKPTVPVLASTQFMNGIFESHVVYGNTKMNMYTTHTRDSLNYFKAQGTRIYICGDDHKYHVLAMPSLFEMTYNGGEWFYQLENDTLIVNDDANSDAQQLTLRFCSRKGKKYSLLVTTQWNNETLKQKPNILDNDVVASPAEGSFMKERCPGIAYKIRYHSEDGEVSLHDEQLIFNAKPKEPVNQIIAKFSETSSFTISTTLAGDMIKNQSMETARKKHFDFIESVLRHITVHTNDSSELDTVIQTNLIIRWFTHDALVHLLSPHGLEQYGGAAWGTRDVSQGPVELFSAFGHYQEVRQIILNLYRHQFIENGNWPQWFMYDQYSDIFADESHGDIIIWPLKVLVDYLNSTGDKEILNEKLPYISLKSKIFSQNKFTLKEHVKKQLEYLKHHFLTGTFVSAYGDGDWDDTLQPADPNQKKYMASTWTEELTIETLRNASAAFSTEPDIKKQVSNLAEKMMKDFKKYFMADKVLPGFIRIEGNNQVLKIIHPTDNITGIKYRLLPLSQGVLSHILTDADAKQALEIIKHHLLFPDGVRLMSAPSVYHGGVSLVFKRAEQAANFGREIGLMYVHAHIRYAAAVSVSGHPEEAWELLQLVNPIKLQKRISNASLRQANTYFSSSDADFLDRYQAQKNFDSLKKQTISVKGGWRLYSSGPGIYIGTLFTNIFKLDKQTILNGESGRYYPDFNKSIYISYSNR